MTSPTATETPTARITVIGRASYGKTVARSIAKSATTTVIATILILVLWQGALIVFDVSSFVGKGPLDVWNFLFTVPVAAENRASALALLGQSLVDASIGFVAGLGAALILAAVFVLIRSVEQALMPLALLLQAVPLIAMAPIIILIFGRDIAAVAVMGGLVVLFPALVTIVFGLRSVSPPMLDLIAVYGGSKLTALTKAALPSAIPAFFAAVKISVPGAITGALIAEWLATGTGIGRGIVSAVGQSKMSEVWSLGIVITIVSIALYMLVGLVESIVLARMGAAPKK